MRMQYVAALGLAVLWGTSTVVRAQNPPTAPAGMPWFFSQTIPDKAQAGYWDAYNAILGPNTTIPPKYQALISLAVSAQIPCQYCVYAFTTASEKAGASKEEIRQAVAIAGIVRMNSTTLQGNEVDFEKFKSTLNAPGK